MLLTPFNTHTSDAVQSKAFSLAATLKGCKGVFFYSLFESVWDYLNKSPATSVDLEQSTDVAVVYCCNVVLL